MAIPKLVIACVLAMATLTVAAAGGWDMAHATFYGDMQGGGTMQGACGYGNLFEQGYGLETTALSTALFNNGLTCGACFEIQCTNDPQWCIPGAIIRVTATNFCPPNFQKPQGNWCNPPQKHFDLSEPMFLKIAKYQSGIVPVMYRRVPCQKRGGLKFQLKGNPFSILVLVFNVGGAGDVVNMKVKGFNTAWIEMKRNWGQDWQVGQNLVGKGMSFQVTTSDGRMVEVDDVVPPAWKFGDSYEGKYNF